MNNIDPNEIPESLLYHVFKGMSENERNQLKKVCMKWHDIAVLVELMQMLPHVEDPVKNQLKSKV